MKPDYVYVASSWRNPMQPLVCAVLKAARIDHYDFRNPAPGEEGFHWSEVMPSYPAVGPGVGEKLANAEEYIEGLSHPLAEHGFKRDRDAMQRADACILILPSGRSSHLELGWFIGIGRPTAILLDGPEVTPELMYKMADCIAPSMTELLEWLGVED